MPATMVRRRSPGTSESVSDGDGGTLSLRPGRTSRPGPRPDAAGDVPRPCRALGPGGGGPRAPGSGDGDLAAGVPHDGSKCDPWVAFARRGSRAGEPAAWRDCDETGDVRFPDASLRGLTRLRLLMPPRYFQRTHKPETGPKC